jgi:hypothetical protein
MILLSTLSSISIRSGTEYSEFEKFNKTRSDFTDTSRSKLNSKSSAALAKAGWTVNDYYMASRWWLHDSNIFNHEKFKLFLENNGEKTSLFSLDTLSFALKSLWQYLIVLLIGMFAIIFCNHGEHGLYRKGWQLPLALTATVFGLLAVAAIRFPTRVAIPAFSFLLMLAIIFRPMMGNLWRTAKSFANVIGIICGIIIVYFSSTLYAGMVTEEAFSKLLRVNTELSMNIVKNRFGKDVMILDANPSNFNMFAEHPSPLSEFAGALNYVSFPFGWMIDSPQYNRFLRENGFKSRSELVPLMIDNPRLILRFGESDEDNFNEFAGYLQKHLQSHYGDRFPGKAILIEKILDRKELPSGMGWVFFRFVSVQSSSQG